MSRQIINRGTMKTSSGNEMSFAQQEYNIETWKIYNRFCRCVLWLDFK